MKTPQTIRPAQPQDLPALTELYNHYVETSPVTFDIEPFSVEKRREWLAQFAPTGPHRLLVAREEDGIAGYACSGRLRPKAAYATSVETTVYLRHDRIGKGLGTALYRALFEALRDEDLHRAFAGITLPNPASLALHQRLGFAPLGDYHEVGRKFERYWTVRWFEKRLS